MVEKVGLVPATSSHAERSITHKDNVVGEMLRGLAYHSGRDRNPRPRH